MGVPPGGPEDKSGPKIVAVYPKSDSTGVSRKLVARLEFSEPVNKSSVEAALFLSPDPVQRLRYRWRGNRLDLEYLDSLDANRTYVISLGSQAKDVRGNPAGTSYTVAFSTGNHIDRGRINGWLTGEENPQAVSIWAYRMGSDTLPDLMDKQSEYKIQSDKDGNFQFAYLRSGRYRLFAVHDLNHDGLWNPDREKIGVPPWDVSVTDSTAPWVSFAMAMQDTAPAQVRSVREVNQALYELRFTRAVNAVHADFVSANGDTVRAPAPYVDPSAETTWRVFPDSMLSTGLWRVAASGSDQMGLAWTDLDTVEVRVKPDTSKPHILASFPADRATLRNLPDSIFVEFDKPVTLDSSVVPWTWMIAERETLNVRFAKTSVRDFTLRADSALVRGKSYYLVINGKAIRDYAGHALGDTTMFVRFGIFSEDSLGAIIGNIVTDKPAQYLADVIEVPGGKATYHSVTNPPHPFRIDLLPPRKYRFQLTRDADGDFTYFAGRMSPFKFSEPFLILPDTVAVRARWEQEVTLNWKEKQ